MIPASKPSPPPPPDSPDRADRLSNLGACLRARYGRSGQLADLQAAIERYEQAVAASPRDSPKRARHLNNLGAGLSDRYGRTGQLADLQAAIERYEQAVAAAPPNSPKCAMFLNNLGNGLSARYWRNDHLADLEAAIERYEQAVDATPPDSPDRAMFLNNLGASFSTLYGRSGQLADLQVAIERYEQAVAATPPDSPDCAGYLNNLGTGLRDRYKQQGEAKDYQTAVEVYATACQLGQEKEVAVTLKASRSWGGWMLEEKQWGEAAKAYGYGLAAMAVLYEAQALHSDRQSWLKEVQGIPANNAYALAQAGQLAQAVLSLTHGQARGLNESLARDRANLAAVQAQAPALALAYEEAAATLRTHIAQERAGQFEHLEARSMPRPHGEMQTARGALQAAIAAIRALPGHATFLLPPSIEEIAAAVHPACPVVYFATTPVGSVALCLHRANATDPLTITPLWLNDFTAQNLNDFLVQRKQGEVSGGYLPGLLAGNHWLFAALDAGLPALGQQLMAPVAEYLQTLGVQQVALVPSGRLALLPLHALYVDDQKNCFLDRFQVHYAPSIQALAQAQAAAQSANAHPRLIGIGNPLPLPGEAKPLRYARPEVEEIAGLFADPALLYEEAATHATVVAALPGADYLHFSCHGLFDPYEPLASGLVLSYGERLTLADVLDRVPVKGARLAVLSACQTAVTGYNDIPDEVIGLPAGFLQAGVTGVVGSLWPVEDHSTALLMHRFYQYHLQGDPQEADQRPLEPAESLRRSQQWLRGVTRQELGDHYQSFIRLTSDEAFELASDILRKRSETPYAHPFYWAAFTFHGV